ncbi:MAG: hypothetical protein A2Z02_06860 [Chloroflexi bacterium RBG_16_48_7]|nr:MAG: hypothetical protein A2Z02_06860 [Chloroflexi bacterium RBG_16_48_7]
MSNEVIGIIGLVVMLTLLFLRMWIGLAMALIGFLGCAYLVGIDKALNVLGTVPFDYIGIYSFAAVPTFLLIGSIIYNTGLATDLFKSVYTWMGELRGGLAIASTLAAALLGVVTDSLVAVTTLGKAAVPEMRKYRYHDTLSTSSIIAGASLASLIPPSVGFILYGILTEQSVGKLFIAAIIPGILLTVLIVGVIFTWARVKPDMAPAGPRTSFGEKISSLKYTWAVVLLIILIIAGIYAGIFTPTEAGGFGAFLAIIIAVVSRRLTIKILLDSLMETAQVTAMIVILMMGAFIFMKFLALSQITFAIGDAINNLQVSKYLIFAIIVLIYILLGMFTEIVSSIILTMPIFYPVIIALGFDPTWFGVIIVIVIEIGFMSPPIGMNVFVLSGITGIPVGTIFRGVWQFVAIILVCIAIMTIFPEIITFLPNTMNR